MAVHPTRQEWAAFGLRGARVWGLADKSNGEAPLWVAQLEVCSCSGGLLRGFRVQDLSREMVHEAFAWNAEDQVVYAFYYHWPDDCFNCIYDDMPLRGWWAWPGPVEGRASPLVAGPELAGEARETREAQEPWEPRRPGEPRDTLDNLFPPYVQPVRRYDARQPDQPRQPDQLYTTGCVIL